MSVDVIQIKPLETINDWAVKNDPDKTNLLWKGSYWPQIDFVRGPLAGLLCDPIDHPYSEYWELVRVCGTYRSKSVLLPVYSINWKRGIRFTLRYNFYDWGLSVEAAKGVVWDFDWLCKPDSVGSYCEGFPKERLFGPWKDDPTKFTVGIQRDYGVYTFMYLLKRQFPAIIEENRGNENGSV